MDLMEAIYHRRAIRDYAPEPVDTATIRMLIEAATQAPSAMNLQPWGFAVVTNRDRLLRFSDEAKAHLLKTVPDFSTLSRYRDRFKDRSFNIFYNAPVLVVVCATSGDTQAAEDCALAAQNFMLAAYGHGLGTCCIGFARPWFNTPAGKAALGIPAVQAPVIPVIVGQPAGAVAAHPRRPPEIHWVSS